MGFHEVARVLANSKTTGYERLAIVALAHRVEDKRGDGAAWPGIDTFAKDVNCSDRFIQKIVKGWRLAPYEVYVIDGGGRFKSNRYIILVGCSFAEVVHRLMVNLNINEQQAEKLAGECGYQKGEHYDISAVAATGNGEHYDIETVNITTPKGEYYAETVNTGSPEQELNINLEPQTIEHQLSSSSPTPPAPAPVAVAVEEKEISKPSDPVLEADEVFQRRLEAFAKLVGVYSGSSARMKAELAGGLRTILEDYPDIQPSHFQRFQEYHHEQNQHRHTGPRYALPTIKYVVGGWGLFNGWWESQRHASQWGFIPGTDRYLGMERWEWDELADMLPDGLIQIRGEWVYRKQADGTFAEVPSAEWPVEWLKESA